MSWERGAGRPATVGVLGAGRMGLPIARQLVGAGFHTIAYRRGAGDELRAAGARVAGSVAELCVGAEVVISLLPSADAVHAVLPELVRGLRPGSVLVDMATLGLAVKKQVRDALEPRGVAMLDCPISGGPMMIPRRENVVLGSGEPDAFEHARPPLESFSANVLYLGVFGTGSRVKFIAQQLVAVHNLAAAEALRYAMRSGIDANTVIAAIVPSIASSRFFEQRAPMMVERRFSPALGPIGMLAKDLPPVLDDADEIGVAMPLLRTAQRYYAAALEAGMGELDVAAMIDALELDGAALQHEVNR
ncbi:2-hydroxy-3-oxopropionate reductase [Vulcanimicrobium alpinum]|uniref:2-hydroxy-3-oxopropionate reductase n=1 Tax=Vulcanimicrobium alpinum TaxID=3016050 RepID=A0AAN1XUY8_UNVUL|nr:NAD(P)-dependent oxidoreductase [Vulcanimicrobium alpinum]BDE05911.1 2-hydroxy-3-oxopropionate reductase [Vulcanimicrobium alpinum]